MLLPLLVVPPGLLSYIYRQLPLSMLSAMINRLEFCLCKISFSQNIAPVGNQMHVVFSLGAVLNETTTCIWFTKV